MSKALDPEVAQLARDVVGSMAPAEVPLFNVVSREYAQDPDRALKAASGKDEVLGFGVEAGILLTPFVISVAETVIKFIGGELLKLGQQAAGAAVDQAVRGAVGHALASPSPGAKGKAVALSAAQLAEVRKVALGRAVALQLPHDQAERLADSMVARLAMAPA